MFHVLFQVADNMVTLMFLCFCLQGEIDAHEDSFKATTEAGEALLNTGHYASEEVKEKVGPASHLPVEKNSLKHSKSDFNRALILPLSDSTFAISYTAGNCLAVITEFNHIHCCLSSSCGIYTIQIVIVILVCM